MRLYRSLYLLLLLLVMHITGQAQLQKVIKDIFSADEITTEHTDSDSIDSSGLQKYDETQAENRTDTEARLATERVGRQRERDEISRQLVADGETYPLFRIGIAGAIPAVPPIFLALQETEKPYPAVERY